MTLVGRKLIDTFVRKHRDAQGWLGEWIRITQHAKWQNINDVRQVYPATDGGVRTHHGKRVTVFNVKGNKYRMITDIIYAAQLIIVLELMTHSQYSKDDWKKRRY